MGMLRKIKSFFTDSIGAKALWLAPVLYIFLTKIAFAVEPPSSISLYDMVRNPFDAILSIFSLILYVISNYILSPILSFVSGTLFNWALNLVITANTAKIVLPAWTYTLSFANNLFILILLAIAVGTILGWTTMNKKNLATFFMVILLINFSLTIGLVVIDTTNALSKFFVDLIQKDGTSLTAQVMQSLDATVILEQTNKTVDAFGSAMNKTSESEKEKEKAAAIEANKKYQQETMKEINPSGGILSGAVAFSGESEGLNAGGDIAKGTLGSNDIKVSALSLFFKFIMIIIFQLIIIGTFLIGAVYMITRTFWLWLLLMVAPIAWIAHLLPKTEEYWKKWWEKFLKWAFFAPIYLFVLSIAVGIAKTTLSMGNLATYSGFSAGQVIQMLCVAFLMMFGIYFGQNTGGSNFVLNYAKKSGAAASKKFKSFMPTQTYGEKAGEWASRLGGRALTLGGRVSVPGVIDKKKFKETAAIETYKKALEKYESETTINLWKMINGAITSRKTSAEITAAVKVFLSRPELERTSIGGPLNSSSLMADIRAMAAAGTRGETTF